MLPVVMKRRSFLVMATTPSPPTSTFMQLIAMTDEHGRPRLRTIRSGAPCEPCQRGPAPQCCTHRLDDVPPWKSQTKEQKLLWLYHGRIEQFLQEQMGYTVDSAIKPFLPRYIADLRARPPHRERQAPEAIFLALDSAHAPVFFPLWNFF